MRKRLYLSGPMSGIEDMNYPAFDAAALRLRASGYEVENPAENPPCRSWADYMRLALVQIARCDVIGMLPGWEKSKGARLEHHIATELGMGVIYVNHFSAAPPAAAILERIDAVEREVITEWRAERVQEVAAASKPPARWTWPWRRA